MKKISHFPFYKKLGLTRFSLVRQNFSREREQEFCGRSIHKRTIKPPKLGLGAKLGCGTDFTIDQRNVPVPASPFPICIFTCRYKINPGVMYVAVIPPRRMFSCFISVLLYILHRFHLGAIKPVHLANRARVSTSHSSDVLLIYGVLARIATFVIFVLDAAASTYFELR